MILIIEDDRDDAELIRYAFDKAGVTDSLVFIEDGAKAIAFVQGADPYADPDLHPRPGLVLLDLRLPRRSGFEVLAAIRNDETMRLTPVIVLTSSTQEADIRRAYGAGANSYLVKPVGGEQLLEMVRSLEAYWINLNRTAAP